MRRGAIVSLIRIEAPNYIEILISALQDKSWVVQLRAAEALAEIGDMRAKDTLIEFSKMDNYRVKQDAIAALRKLGYDPDGPQT